MTQHSHQTAPTQFVEANGIRFAYRRFGNAAGVPIVFNEHYIGSMDYWDPAVTDGLARDREVILFNNAGVSSSSGEVPTTFEQMGANAIAFIKALGLKLVDVLGFSIGGMVAQEITLQAPNLVRKLILVGTGPRGGGELIANVGVTAGRGNRLPAKGLADLVAFGRHYIANPDLVERLATGAPLAEIDLKIVYASGPRGYSDYPAIRQAAAE
jgi:pimeloyl-ACP methyl ester carboxylesterase